MILINYRTNEYYQKSVGDKLYCKSFRSAKQELKDRNTCFYIID